MQTALGVEEHHSLAVWVGGDTGHCQASQMEHVVWDTTSSHYIMDKKANDRTTSAGKSLMQGNILYNARNIDGICPRWTGIAKRTRRQNSSSTVQGINSKYTVNTLTDNTGHEQFYLLAFKMIHSLSGYVQWLRQRKRITLLFNHHNFAIRGRVLCVSFRQQSCKLVFTLALFCLVNHCTLWLDKAMVYANCFTEYARNVPCQISLSNDLLQRHLRQC